MEEQKIKEIIEEIPQYKVNKIANEIAIRITNVFTELKDQHDDLLKKLEQCKIKIAKFKDENISSELAMVIGCITESQKLINDAVESEEKGGSVNMCKALEKLEERGRQEGRLEGRLQGQIVTKLKLILKKVHKNKSFDQIVDELEEDSDVVQPLYDFVLKHIDLGEDEMVQKYLENIE